MFLRFFVLAVPLALSVATAQAQSPALSFDNAAYLTCREAQAMTPEARRAVAIFLIDHAARRRGVVIPEDDRGAQLGHLVRGGCTLRAGRLSVCRDRPGRHRRGSQASKR